MRTLQSDFLLAFPWAFREVFLAFPGLDWSEERNGPRADLGKLKRQYEMTSNTLQDDFPSLLFLEGTDGALWLSTQESSVWLICLYEFIWKENPCSSDEHSSLWLHSFHRTSPGVHVSGELRQKNSESAARFGSGAKPKPAHQTPWKLLHSVPLLLKLVVAGVRSTNTTQQKDEGVKTVVCYRKTEKQTKICLCQYSFLKVS